MLKIKAKTGRDSFGGKGLFAAEDIPAGTVVWAYDPAYTIYIPVEDYLARQKAGTDTIMHFTYPIYAPEEDLVGVLVNMDDSRYMNHSIEPNTGMSADSNDQDVALRPIKKGEELTCNYYDFDPDDVIHKMGVETCKSFLIEQHASFDTKKSAGDRQ